MTVRGSYDAKKCTNYINFNSKVMVWYKSHLKRATLANRARSHEDRKEIGKKMEATKYTRFQPPCPKWLNDVWKKRLAHILGTRPPYTDCIHSKSVRSQINGRTSQSEVMAMPQRERNEMKGTQNCWIEEL